MHHAMGKQLRDLQTRTTCRRLLLNHAKVASRPRPFGSPLLVDLRGSAVESILEAWTLDPVACNPPSWSRSVGAIPPTRRDPDGERCSRAPRPHLGSVDRGSRGTVVDALVRACDAFFAAAGRRQLENAGVRVTSTGVTNRRMLGYRSWSSDEIDRFASVRQRTYLVTGDRRA
jgi:hypothetical protein